MPSLTSLLIRLKQHLFAPRYLREKEQKIFGLRQQLKEMYEHADMLKHEIAKLNRVKVILDKTLADHEPLLSYAQTGEDKILAFLFNDLGIVKPSYLDVGANYPIHLSNTYFLYLQGNYGVCVEPDPELYAGFKEIRPRDRCLNIGIGASNTDPLPFYVFENDAKGLNTFSKEQADYVEGLGRFKVETVLHVSLKNINEVISENFDTHPDFLSLDVEGLDYEILNSLDYDRYPIDVICVETIKYDSNGFREKEQNTIDLLLSKGYLIYADTHINTIFVSQAICLSQKHTEVTLQIK